MHSCHVRQELSRAATVILDEIIATNRLQIHCLQSGDYQTLLKHDKQLENLVGEKERAFGALQQHVREHGC